MFQSTSKIHKKCTKGKLTRAQRCCTFPQQKVLKVGLKCYPLFTLEAPRRSFSPEKWTQFFFLDLDYNVTGGVNSNNGEHRKSNKELHLDGKG